MLENGNEPQPPREPPAESTSVDEAFPPPDTASSDGVTIAWVRTRTRPAGPFPTTPTAAQLARRSGRGRDSEVVEEWVRRRQAVKTVAAIAPTADVRPATSPQ